MGQLLVENRHGLVADADCLGMAVGPVHAISPTEFMADKAPPRWWTFAPPLARLGVQHVDAMLASTREEIVLPSGPYLELE